ncbi:MAG: hypothetical protein JRG71_05615, partial [Deltaproteobacteria bacterium]|nr:hypothetical protein [Deltaproteobacteria bacterium]
TPSTAIIRDGTEVDTSGDEWILSPSGNKRILKFHRLRNFCSAKFVNSVKWVFYINLAQLSTQTSYNYLWHFIKFIEFVGEQVDTVDQITVIDLMNYRTKNQGYFNNLRGLFKVWAEHEYYGLESAMKEFLTQPNMAHRSAVELDSVRTLDPHTGPLLEIEENIYRQAVLARFEGGKISLQSFCLAMLILTFGMRPAQLEKMKLKHLIIRQQPDGSRNYCLRVPWVKQKTYKTPQLFPLGQTLAESMFALAESVRLRFSESSFYNVMKWDEIPFFLKVNSSKPMSDTVGTRLAVKGNYTARMIADFLMQTNERSTQPYVDISENLLKDFNEYWDPTLKRYANIALNIIDDENITGPTITFSTNGRYRPKVGKCGKIGCKALAPLACYGCESFRPLLHAPHSEYLKTLLSERERLMEVDPLNVGTYDKAVWFVKLTIERCLQIEKNREE